MLSRALSMLKPLHLKNNRMKKCKMNNSMIISGGLLHTQPKVHLKRIHYSLGSNHPLKPKLKMDHHNTKTFLAPKIHMTK